MYVTLHAKNGTKKQTREKEIEYYLITNGELIHILFSVPLSVNVSSNVSSAYLSSPVCKIIKCLNHVHTTNQYAHT